MKLIHIASDFDLLKEGRKNLSAYRKQEFVDYKWHTMDESDAFCKMVIKRHNYQQIKTLYAKCRRYLVNAKKNNDLNPCTLDDCMAVMSKGMNANDRRMAIRCIGHVYQQLINH